MKQVALFRELDESQINMLMPLFEPFSCQVGTIILKQDTQADYLYLILSGTVEMSFKPYDGASFTLSYAEKGDLFGWSALVGNERYSSSAIAVEDVEAYRVRGSSLREFCLEHPEAGVDILERLADGVSFRWRNAHEQIKSLILRGMTQ